MSGYPLMRYHVEFSVGGTGLSSHERIEEFYKVVRWCEDQYGQTRQLNDLILALDNHSTATDVNRTWTWVRDQFRTKVMFAEKEQAAYYALVFGV